MKNFEELINDVHNLLDKEGHVLYGFDKYFDNHTLGVLEQNINIKSEISIKSLAAYLEKIDLINLLYSLLLYKFNDIKVGKEYMKALLIEKNKKYGNAILEPKRFFSTTPISDVIRSRIDEKISRILNSDKETDNEDAYIDWIGYLYFLIIAEYII